MCSYVNIFLMKLLLSCQKFLCAGRLVFGRDGKSLFLTTFMIGGPALLFCIRMLLTIKDDPHFSFPVLIGAVVIAFLVGKNISFLTGS